MKHSLLVLSMAGSLLMLSGCAATLMQTGEGVIRTLTPASGPLNSIGTYAADVHKGVRHGVLGDTTLIPSDPANKETKQ